MTERGSLIFPMAVEIERIDTTGTRGSGGYDDTFQEPRVFAASQLVPGIPDKGAPRGDVATQYLPPIIVEAQVETRDINTLRAALTGKDNIFKIALVIHYEELEERGLIDANGNPLFRSGDRLTRILDPDTHELVMVIPDPPGAYATEDEDQSFGLSGVSRNLLHITFQNRDRSLVQ